jgi:glyoxylase-like metal-dependent hydrolase (beta-lactamase superfamily II)
LILNLVLPILLARGNSPTSGSLLVLTPIEKHVANSLQWRRGCLLAVDAGVHLAAIAKILEGHKADESGSGDKHATTLVDGPFEGLQIPHSTANANAAHITRTLVDTYLITHPHLDHISGFVVNTAALPGSRPKRLAGLPSTIEAFKNHIFNNVIWPNLSDENNGAGLVTYMRLVLKLGV